eukprot:1153447-Pelagomonas_calceolata.AAC.5
MMHLQFCRSGLENILGGPPEVDHRPPNHPHPSNLLDWTWCSNEIVQGWLWSPIKAECIEEKQRFRVVL